MSIPPPDPSSVALITGASAGIGEQFARQLSARGHRVALVARRAERLDQLASELGGPERAFAISADLAVPEDRDRLAADLEQRGATVELLVNNAGFGIYGAFVDSDREQELRQLRVDVEAVIDLTARYLPGMVNRGRGAIINLSSSSGFVPSPYNASYAAAKAHVLHLSEALNVELKGSGVSVTAVCPGPVRTEFQQANEIEWFFGRVPKFTILGAERVAADALRAADRGKRAVVPGNLLVKAFFGSARWSPNPVRLLVTKRIMKPA
jgi:short-subunit dehydrogenase